MFRRIRDMTRGFTFGAAAGAALAYFLDPDRGKARRARTRDQLLARSRDVLDQAETKARYLEGEVEGLAYRLTPKTGQQPSVDGRTLADKVRSEILGKQPFRDYPITVDADNGTVHLRGEVNRPEIVRALRSEIEKMPEVARVENLIHPPGTPAPNKAEARQA